MWIPHLVITVAVAAMTAASMNRAWVLSSIAPGISNDVDVRKAALRTLTSCKLRPLSSA